MRKVRIHKQHFRSLHLVRLGQAGSSTQRYVLHTPGWPSGHQPLRPAAVRLTV
jgi:hypothetical protein